MVSGVPHLTTALKGPLLHLEKHLLMQQTQVERWFREQWLLTPAPFYASVDLRNAGFKLAPVDTNLFPAGFNNLNADFMPLCIQAAQAAIERACPQASKVLIVAENHTRNLFYLESLEKLNINNPLHTKFTVSSELSKLNVDSVRTLLNLTEQEKLRLSYNTYLYFHQGLLNSMIQNFNQSLKAYSTAIALNPEFDLAYFNRANTRFLMIEYLNSLEEYSQVITLEGKATTHKNDKNRIYEPS